MIETVADKQLYDFNRQVVRQQYTLDQGLWRYCRHPNYFGEWIMWLAWFVYAIPSGKRFDRARADDGNLAVVERNGYCAYGEGHQPTPA